MLKPQDLLVTLKILSFEVGNQSKLAQQLQGRAWLAHDESLEHLSSYDSKNDELFVSEEPGDFEKATLEAIDDYLRLNAPPSGPWTYRTLASQLFISLGETNKAVKRAVAAGLLINRGNRNVRVNRQTLVDFISYGVKVSFFTERGRVVRGIPTAYAAPVFNEIFASSSNMPTVWPCARGTVKGVAIDPLYQSVTKAVMIDAWLYKQLALIDIYRIGNAREREAAQPFILELLGSK